MERYILTLLAIVMCLLESKTQAMNPNYDGSTSTITLDKGEYLYQQVEKKALKDIVTNDNDAHKFNPDNDHLYITVEGTINSADVGILCGTELHYSSVDMSLLNASYVKEEGKTDYAHFSLSKAGGNLKSIALPSDMDVIGDNFDFY